MKFMFLLLFYLFQSGLESNIEGHLTGDLGGNGEFMWPSSLGMEDLIYLGKDVLKVRQWRW